MIQRPGSTFLPGLLYKKQGDTMHSNENKTETKKNQKGFTLVEIAIVLVIIGLLLGGVLKGQELIENSKARALSQDFENLAAAYYSYRDRVGAYPGSADDDDGIPTTQFWLDLRAQGFITGADDDNANPTHSFDGEFSFLGDDDTGGAIGDNIPQICADSVPALVAQGIDTKSDDGDREAGTYQAGADYTADTDVTLCREL
ncbi:MAG: prepilin-type N-terminal cleavage/methylation domain-containing protein [Hydrogenovibrio sp.]|uniref:prepilin-type N-terminal cleavage/methylation domain-containing protein n=1 Tax=Hydrogenovibrio sp. TaxID=2065821 RepID=UPI002870394A|nr:prepilin-type N-terminal cleavage/methylation domain-containing protein [Hydrogenovibrio sp.]MDR9500149.1 prepilin-type N-terminal cleavage/methylation domain-containing protein [Hydrogenovibrio sp.]